MANIFSDIVKLSLRQQDEDELEEKQVFDIDLNDCAFSTLHKEFWARLSEVALGVLKVSTYNGEVVMRKVSHAKSFGAKLYMHLTTRSCHKYHELLASSGSDY